MFVTDIFLDRVPATPHLSAAFGLVFDSSPDQVAVIPNAEVERVSDVWSDSEIQLILRTSHQNGDFPFVVGIMLHNAKPHDFVRRLEQAAERLGISMLTDEAARNPYSDSEYLLIGADGRSEFVHVDTEDWDSNEPTLSLLPASRSIHRAHAKGYLQHAD